EGWPGALRRAVGNHAYIVSGGLEIDGRPIADIAAGAIRTACPAMRAEVDAVAVVGVFSPIDAFQYEAAASLAVARRGFPVSPSAQLGSLGLLERENATVLNAALIETLRSMAEGLNAALRQRGIDARMYFGQNDG